LKLLILLAHFSKLALSSILELKISSRHFEIQFPILRTYIFDDYTRLVFLASLLSNLCFVQNNQSLR